MKRLPLCLLLASSLVPVRAAAPANPAAERIREGELKQTQLRNEAQQLVEQLDGMLGEYERNGLAGDDAKTVAALREALAKLSGADMKQVGELLEKARGSADGGAAKKEVSAAYTAQKAVITQMKKLLADHLRNQQALELAQQLTQLADRQAANLQNGISLGQWTGGRKPENFEAAMQANMEGQRSEQASIAAEMKAIAESIAKFARDPANAAQAERFQKGVEALQKVTPNAEGAAESLKQAQLFKAVAEEKVARDALRKLAREIAPAQDHSEALRAAERELAKLIEDQKEIAKDAVKAVGEKDFDRWLDQQMEKKQLDPKLAKLPREQLQQNKDLQKRFQDQRAGRLNELLPLEDKQGDLAGKNDDAAQKLEGAAPAAAADLKAAHEKMQEARAAMTEKNGEAAAKNTREALAAMQAAAAKVQQEIAKADAAAGKGGDPAKDLAQMKNDFQELAKQEAAAAQNPDKSGQAAIAEKAAQLAQQAATAAPQAAQAANQAAANAQRAAQAAQAGQPAAAAAAQEAAAQQLAEAAKQVGEQLAEVQAEQQELAAAEKAAAELAAIIIAEQKLEMDTAKGAALVAAKKVAPTAAFTGQSARQQEVRAKTDSFKNTLPVELAAAVPALGEASTAMYNARAQLEKLDGERAKAAELKALAALYRAQQAVGQIADEAREELAMNNAAQEANAQQQAQAQIAQAQAATAQAQQDLQKAEAAQAAAAQAAQAGDQAGAQMAAQQAAQASQQAAAALAQAAQKAGQAAAQATPGNEAAQAAAQQAEQAAAEAAAQAAAENAPAAAAQAAAAQAAMAQAQAAMAQAQAGISQAASPKPGEGKGQGQGQGQGQGEGQGQGQGKGKGMGKGQGKGGGAGQPGQPSSEPGSGAEKYEPGGAGEGVQVGARKTAAKKASFAALPPRERAVIEQSQSEKYPEEYGAQVEQYLLNLANESSAKK